MVDVPSWSSRYRPSTPITWQGRRDGPGAVRYHEVVKIVDLRVSMPTFDPHDIILLGFACDEGIRRNQGRVGAAAGPMAVRQALGKLPFLVSGNPALFDLGDITCEDGNLEATQKALSDIVAYIIAQGARPIVCGGGHELVWGHYLGILDKCKCKHIGILNLDAHIDLRPLLEGGLGTSGTSFTQIADEREACQSTFDYLCIGIQRFANTQVLVDSAKARGSALLEAEVIHRDGLTPALDLINQQIQRSDCLLATLCLDVFASPFAPGVSASLPLGLTPWQVQPLIRQIAASNKLVAFNIAELSPGYDQDGRTASLAAVMLANLVEVMTSVTI